MNKYLFLAAALVVGTAQTAAGAPAQSVVTQYLNNPTEANAKLAAQSVPLNGNRIELSPADSLLIRNQLVSGSANSLRLVLALIPLSDGGNLEDLMALAASAIRPQPVTFLQVVYEVKLDRKTLESILLMAGVEYVDRPVAKKLEIEMRRAAIASSTQNNLGAIRDLCVQLLDTELNR